MATKEPQSIPPKSRQQGHQGRPNPIQIQKYLGGLEYPASKEAILEKARGEGADLVWTVGIVLDRGLRPSLQ
jgi:hypothetical protein